MKQPEDLKRELVGQWLTKAEKDFVAAGILLESNPFVLGVVGFLAQQAVEKYLKAYLVWKQIYFPKTHNIAALLVLVSEADECLASELMPARTLSQYAVESRYPGDLPELSRDEASRLRSNCPNAFETPSVQFWETLCSRGTMVALRGAGRPAPPADGWHSFVRRTVS